jgi:Uma2 family endonuclease
MRGLAEDVGYPPVVVQTAPLFELDDEQLFRLCMQNQEARIERNADGELEIMMPEGFSSGVGNAKLAHLFYEWAERDGTGVVTGASAGFRLPNKAMRAPDVSWTLKERIAKLTPKERKRFAPLCPDFVLELRSESDSLATLKAKMEEYIANGARLGWLLDPVRKQAHIYEPGKPPRLIVRPKKLSGEPVLHGFVLDVPALWAVIEGKR